jgi:hypothetical protein
MRNITLTVGSKPLRDQKTWAYPAGNLGVYYWVPVYDLFVRGTDGAGMQAEFRFDVLRFGVQCTDRTTARVVGLAEHQVHVIKRWIPTYSVHSATSTEDGAWQVYDNFLIHDGPDNAGEIFATIGCIEIMGKRGFVRFNETLLALSGLKGASGGDQLTEIGRSKRMMITYEKAQRPPLRKV